MESGAEAAAVAYDRFEAWLVTARARLLEAREKFEEVEKGVFTAELNGLLEQRPRRPLLVFRNDVRSIAPYLCRNN